jgi:predicted glycosyltransferase
MKILIDIGHPAHVHYFRNMIAIMSKKGHEFIVIARERDVIFSLLNFYQIDYICRGKGRASKFGKLLYMLKADYMLLRLSLKLKPDLFLSFSSPYAAQVAKLTNKPHIALNDTEHTDKSHAVFTYPFSEIVLTPNSYQNDLGTKHIRFNGIMEALYLQKKYFTPNPDIYKMLGLETNEKYILLRFVSWKAHHDYGQSGLTHSTLKRIIQLLETKYRVFISSEKELEPEFEKYRLEISPETMHDVLNYAELFIGESGTMASESAYLGTHAVYTNSLPLMCYLKQEQVFGLLKHFESSKSVLKYVQELIKSKNLKTEAKRKSEMMKKDFIDATAFLTWFIENYPKSAAIMKENPDYQYRFK